MFALFPLCDECPDEVVRDNKRNLIGFVTNSSINRGLGSA